ncbi:hypothetical protein [Streptomyces sp. NPDC092307]|uniref:hypothetical protein n=1 Tax=Streptomyces sp. NPDC092307 TaxID=3366013 RepID=UPI00381445DD
MAGPKWGPATGCTAVVVSRAVVFGTARDSPRVLVRQWPYGFGSGARRVAGRSAQPDTNPRMSREW